MQLGRYADAVKALRRVNELSTPTADSLTDLGEALMMAQDGSVAGEPLDSVPPGGGARSDACALALLHRRRGDADRRLSPPRSRDWNALLALAKGDEPWVVTAQNGLRFAEERPQPDGAPARRNPTRRRSTPWSTGSTRG